jgi:hypothetical protein
MSMTAEHGKPKGPVVAGWNEEPTATNNSFLYVAPTGAILYAARGVAILDQIPPLVRVTLFDKGKPPFTVEHPNVEPLGPELAGRNHPAFPPVALVVQALELLAQR